MLGSDFCAPPCTAGADNFFFTSPPHSGQGGAASLILCMAVKSFLQDWH
jgi:hypothetical protein